MSDQMRQLSDIKWQATGVDGHTHHTCGEWMYTSDAPPVEADEYERMKQRAEAAEAAIAAVPRQAIDALFRQQFGSYAHRRIGELERALADEREGHAIDNDEGAEIIIDIKRQVERLKAIAPEGVFSPEDFSIINLMGDVRLLTAQLAAAIKRAEAAEAARDALALELAHLRPEWQAMRDERDAFESWSNTLESAGWQDAGFCPHCGKDDVRKSIDVLEPDAAKEIHYCCSCGRAWVIGHKQPTRV